MSHGFYIDCDSPRMPYEILRAIAPYENEIHTYYSGKATSSVELTKAIEPIGKQYHLIKLLEEQIEPFLSTCQLSGWHMTRVVHVDSLMHSGILAQDKHGFAKRCEELCAALNISGDAAQDVIRKALRTYERGANRQGTICLYSSRTIENSYLQYADSLGGETFRWAVESLDEQEYVRRLSCLGVPLAIKFSYDYGDTLPIYKERVSLAIIKATISTLLFGECNSLEFDSCITSPVPSDDFISVIELEQGNDGLVKFSQ